MTRHVFTNNTTTEDVQTLASSISDSETEKLRVYFGLEKRNLHKWLHKKVFLHRFTQMLQY